MSVVYLTEADVARLLDMPATVDVVEQSFRRMAAGDIANVPRERAIGKGVILHTMSAADNGIGYVGWKAYTTTKSGPRFLVGLYEAADGKLAALIEADQLGQLRTGATTGVAVRHLAADDADRVGLFGTGTQARTQLAAVAAVRKLRQAVVFGRDETRRKEFAAQMSAELGIDVVPAAAAIDAVRGLPIIVTATTSRTPVFAGDDVTPETLVCAVGSNWLNKAEIDATTVRRAAHVVCDDVAACRHEAGDLHAAAEAGAFDWSKAINLAEVVAGRVSAKPVGGAITVFKSVGLAAEDVALGVEIVRRAAKSGVGATLPID
jgi:ornithine cyclodeaminase/alanine dehydrogenase-like protein (mu-crystallin family)